MKFSTGTEFENPPIGLHVGRCFWVIDLGTQQHVNRINGETWTQRDLKILFELPNTKMRGIYNPEVRGKPFAVALGFGGVLRQSLAPQSAFRRYLQGWRGRVMTKEEASPARFDVRKLLGKSATLNLQASEDGQFINVVALAPLQAGVTCPKAINKPLYLSLEADEFDPEVYKLLPQRLQQKIAGSREYRALFAGQDGGSDEGPPAEEDQIRDGSRDEAGADDNVPF